MASPVAPGEASAAAGAAADSNSKFVSLVSNDGFSFVVTRSAATRSDLIRRMLDPVNGFKEAHTNTCVFDNINAIVLEKVCEYFYYYEKNKDQRDVPDMEIPPELCLELLMAADYLGT